MTLNKRGGGEDGRDTKPEWGGGTHGLTTSPVNLRLKLYQRAEFKLKHSVEESATQTCNLRLTSSPPSPGRKLRPSKQKGSNLIYIIIVEVARNIIMNADVKHHIQNLVNCVKAQKQKWCTSQ